MKDTGFRSSFIDIMMLRPDARTSAMAVCSAGSAISTTPPHLAPIFVPREAEIAHHLDELLHLARVLVRPVVEFDQQHGLGLFAHEFLERRAEHRDRPGEIEHRLVDQLDRDRAQLHQMLGRVHRLVELAEMADADHALAEHRPELQLAPAW